MSQPTTQLHSCDKADVDCHKRMSHTEKDSIISSTFSTIINLPNTIITAYVNAQSPLWHSPTEDHKGELIKGIMLYFDHITLNTNTPTRLPPNQTQ